MKTTIWSFAALFAALHVVAVAGFSSSSSATTDTRRNENPCIVVVGKVIIDDYRTPDQRVGDGIISVGGGGPQAAWGAAAALAIIGSVDKSTDADQSSSKSRTSLPPKQAVNFLGPVGGDWSSTEQESLESIIGSAVESIQLIKEPSLQTPRIQLWHNADQEIQWTPLNDSWGSKGADSLWRNRPSAQDILEAVGRNTDGSSDRLIDNLHMILEVGATAAGGGRDSELLLDKTLMSQVRHVGIEPIAFPDEATGIVSTEDSASCRSRLLQYPKIDLVAPDRHLLEAMEIDSFWNQFDVAARYGPQGSKLWNKQGTHGDMITVPVASLATSDGQPVNPTGAGNAFSAAVSTCRAMGLTLVDSACIATAIGAVFCEHEHIPPWTWETIDRIRRGAEEVTKKVIAKGTFLPESRE